MIKTNPEFLQYKDESTSEDSPDFELLVDTQVVFDYLGLTYHTLIPAGWNTDFGSVPSMVRWIVPNMGKWDKAYVLHDWMYTKGCPLNLSKNDADIILWKNLKELGMASWKANLVYQCVRYGGQGKWRV